MIILSKGKSRFEGKGEGREEGIGGGFNLGGPVCNVAKVNYYLSIQCTVQSDIYVICFGAESLGVKLFRKEGLRSY